MSDLGLVRPLHRRQKIRSDVETCRQRKRAISPGRSLRLQGLHAKWRQWGLSGGGNRVVEGVSRGGGGHSSSHAAHNTQSEAWTWLNAPADPVYRTTPNTTRPPHWLSLAQHLCAAQLGPYLRFTEVHGQRAVEGCFGVVCGWGCGTGVGGRASQQPVK